MRKEKNCERERYSKRKGADSRCVTALEMQKISAIRREGEKLIELIDGALT